MRQAVQENMMDQASQFEGSATVGNLTSDKLSPVAEVGDENDHSEKNPQPSSV